MTDNTVMLYNIRRGVWGGWGEHQGTGVGEDLCLSLTVEGRVPAEENVHNHSDRPDVTFLIVLPLQYLRGDVVRCAHSVEEGEVWV